MEEMVTVVRQTAAPAVIFGPSLGTALLFGRFCVCLSFSLQGLFLALRDPVGHVESLEIAPTSKWRNPVAKRLPWTQPVPCRARKT